MTKDKCIFKRVCKIIGNTFKSSNDIISIWCFFCSPIELIIFFHWVYFFPFKRFYSEYLLGPSTRCLSQLPKLPNGRPSSAYMFANGSLKFIFFCVRGIKESEGSATACGYNKHIWGDHWCCPVICGQSGTSCVGFLLLLLFCSFMHLAVQYVL